MRWFPWCLEKRGISYRKKYVGVLGSIWVTVVMQIYLDLMMGRETRMTLNSTSAKLLRHSLHGYIDGRHQHMELASVRRRHGYSPVSHTLPSLLLSCGSELCRRPWREGGKDGRHSRNQLGKLYFCKLYCELTPSPPKYCPTPHLHEIHWVGQDHHCIAFEAEDLNYLTWVNSLTTKGDCKCILHKTAKGLKIKVWSDTGIKENEAILFLFLIPRIGALLFQLSL